MIGMIGFAEKRPLTPLEKKSLVDMNHRAEEAKKVLDKANADYNQIMSERNEYITIVCKDIKIPDDKIPTECKIDGDKGEVYQEESKKEEKK